MSNITREHDIKEKKESKRNMITGHPQEQIISTCKDSEIEVDLVTCMRLL